MKICRCCYAPRRLDAPSEGHSLFHLGSLEGQKIPDWYIRACERLGIDPTPIPAIELPENTPTFKHRGRSHVDPAILKAFGYRFVRDGRVYEGIWIKEGQESFLPKGVSETDSPIFYP